MKTLTGTMALAGTVVVSALALTGCNLDVDVDKKTQDRSYDVTGKISTIKLSSDVGKIEVTGSDSPVVKVRERMSWSSERRKPQTRHEVQGGELTLGYKCEGNVIGFSSCGVEYQIQVPRALALELNSGDGRLDVRGLHGALRLTTDTGAITATDLKTTSLHATTGDGSIKLSGEASTTELRTDTGSINADGLSTTRLDAHTGDGSIRVRFTAPPGTIDATTDTGSVEFAVPASQPYAISLSADTGRLDVDSAVRRDDDAPRKIKVRTGDGSVHIRPA